jgi:glycine/D-amino acid oxidase-like deaminating enzyme
MWIRPSEVIAALGSPYGERLLRMLSDAPSTVFELIDKYGLSCEPQRRGTLHCAVGKSGLNEISERAAQWKERGARVSLLGATETAVKVGSRLYAGSLWDLRAGTIQPLAYVRGLAQAAIDAGARIHTRSPVISADRRAGRWTVRTGEGSVTSEWVVVATDAYAKGPWIRIREEQVELPYFNVATAPLADRIVRSILPDHQGAWDTRTVLRSVRLDAAGRLIFGSVGALCGSAAHVHIAWAKRALQKMFPQLEDICFEYAWYGRIGLTPNRLPRFHKLAANVVAFSGYNGRGIAPGTVFGRLLAQYIFGRIPDHELPLPLTSTSEQPWLPGLKRALYRFGSQAVHAAGARL